jgi:hypothetical protein
LTPQDLETEDPDEEEISWSRSLQWLLQEVDPSWVVRPARFLSIRKASQDSETAYERGLALSPDEVVYGLHRCLNAEGTPEEAAADWEGKKFPRLVFLRPGKAPVLAGPGARTVSTMEEYLLAQTLIRELARNEGKLRGLTPGEIRFLEDMESEKYRQALLQR